MNSATQPGNTSAIVSFTLRRISARFSRLRFRCLFLRGIVAPQLTVFQTPTPQAGNWFNAPLPEIYLTSPSSPRRTDLKKRNYPRGQRILRPLLQTWPPPRSFDRGPCAKNVIQRTISKESAGSRTEIATSRHFHFRPLSVRIGVWSNGFVQPKNPPFFIKHNDRLP